MSEEANTKRNVVATYTGSQPDSEFVATFEKTFQENKDAAAELLVRVKAKVQTV